MRLVFVTLVTNIFTANASERVGSEDEDKGIQTNVFGVGTSKVSCFYHYTNFVLVHSKTSHSV